MLPILDAGIIGAHSQGPILIDMSNRLGDDESVGEIVSVKVYRESNGEDVTDKMFSSEKSQASGKEYYCWISGGGDPSDTPTVYILYVVIASDSSPAKHFPVYIRFQVVDPYVAG